MKTLQKEGLCSAIVPLIINKLNDRLLTQMRLFCRYGGIITGISDADPAWRASKWKCLMVNCLF
jgi:hypothetical protein